MACCRFRFRGTVIAGATGVIAGVASALAERLPVLRLPVVNHDDGECVCSNAPVLGGLSIDTARRAFSAPREVVCLPPFWPSVADDASVTGPDLTACSRRPLYVLLIGPAIIVAWLARNTVGRTGRCRAVAAAAYVLATTVLATDPVAPTVAFSAAGRHP